MKLKGYLNRLLLDRENGVYWTLEKDPHKRVRPYILLQAQREQIPARAYGRSAGLRPVASFQPFAAGLSEFEALERIEAWKLVIVPAWEAQTKAYAALLAESERTGLPREYRTDLTRCDFAVLHSEGWNPGRCFLWFLRSHGTHLLSVDPERVDLSSGNNPVDLLRAFCRIGHDEAHYYHWDGERLRELPYERAEAIAADAMREAEQLQREARRRG